MKKILFSVAFFTVFQAYNQIPTKVWDSTIGGASRDFATGMVATNDGGFVIVGQSQSNISGDKTEASKGGIDFWIVKLNSTGQKVWDKTIGGSGSESASSVIATTDGGFIVAGNSNSNISGDKTEASKGSNDYWLVKINSVGQKVWDKTIGGSGNEFATSIVSTPDGGFVVAGQSNSGISGDKTEVNKGGYDYWIVKLNSSGQIVWDKAYGGSLNDVPNDITTTIDGEFVIVGDSNSGISGDKTEASKGSSDFWILKLNSVGQILWDKTIGGSSSDVPNGIAITNDGGYVVAGYSSSGISGDKSEANKGSEDFWAVKLNSLGQKVWDKTLGGNLRELVYSIIATPTGEFIITGDSYSGISGDKTEASRGGFDDAWIVKINNLGQKIWDKTLGAINNVNSFDFEIAYAITLTNDGGFVITSNSNSLISGDKTQDGRGQSDFWIVKLSDSTCPNTLTPTGTITSNQKAANTVITVAGNASNGTLNIIPNSANVTYQGGQNVLLNPGFVASQGSIFTAKILAGCN